MERGQQTGRWTQKATLRKWGGLWRKAPETRDAGLAREETWLQLNREGALNAELRGLAMAQRAWEVLADLALCILNWSLWLLCAGRSAGDSWAGRSLTEASRWKTGRPSPGQAGAWWCCSPKAELRRRHKSQDGGSHCCGWGDGRLRTAET